MKRKLRSRVSMILIAAVIFTLIPFQPMSVVFAEDNGIFLDDDTSSLTAADWWLYYPPETGVYITDHGNSGGNPNSIALKPVVAGQYLLYGDGTASGYNAISKNFTIGPGAWKLKFGARFAELITPSQNFTSAGIAFVVNANEKNYKISFNDSNRVYFQGVTAAYNDELEEMPTDDEIHAWEIRFDGDETVSLWLDGVKVAEHDDMGSPVPSAPDGMTIYNLPSDAQSGTTEVYLQGIQLIRPTEGITLAQSNLTVAAGDSETLIASVIPSNAGVRTIAWASSNPAIATVNASGIITAISPGTAKITATTEDGGFVASCDVTVISAVGTLFEDNAANFHNAGWTLGPVSVPVPNAYVIDSSVSSGNPNQVLLKPVEQGQYLIYGDKIASDNGTYTVLSKKVDIGPGAWTLDFTAKFTDLMTPQDSENILGISFDIVANKKLYKFTFNDKNKVLIQKDLSGTYYKKQLDALTDNAFHNVKIAFDGLNTVSLLLDNIKVAEYEGTGLVTSEEDGLTIWNFPLEWKSGTNELYLDSIKLEKTANNVIVHDEASNLAVAQWTADAPAHASYITDNSRSNGTIVGMKPVEAGRYLVYGDNQAADATRISRPVAIGHGTWVLEFDARIADLVTPASDDPTKGLSFEIVAGGKLYKFTLNDKDKLFALKSTAGAFEQQAINIPKNAYFHNWKVGLDENNRMFVTVDGNKVAVFDDVGLPVDEPERISIINDSVGAAGRTTEVYFDSISLVKNVHPLWYKSAINGVTILPASDSASIRAIVSTFDVDPLTIADHDLSIQAKLYKDDQLISENTQTVTGPTVFMNLNPQSQTGNMQLVLKLLRGNYELNELIQRVEVRSAVARVQANQTIAAAADKVYLFTQMNRLVNSTGSPPLDSGWKQSHYQYDGSSEGGVFLENQITAEALQVPVTLNGWFGVYIGYVSGTESFGVTDGINDHDVSIDGSVFDPAAAYGSKAISEVFAMADNFSGNKVQIFPVTGKSARIAYVKFKSLTSDEIAIASQPDEGAAGKRVIYNNDGNTQFANGLSYNEAALKADDVDIYYNQDVSAIHYATGTTLFAFYDSQVLGTPYANVTPAIEAAMADTSKKIRDVVLQFVHDGKNPLEIVASRSQQLGMKTLASLRMNAFYPYGEDEFLNGNLYPQYETYRYQTYYGANLGTYLSYGYTQVHDVIEDLLREAVSFQGVQGIELDFDRYPYVLGWEPILSDGYMAQYGKDPKLENTPSGLHRWHQYRADVMTGFIRELRQALPGKQIAVRIPTYGYLSYGLDIEAWIEEGLIDVLVPSSLYHERFWDNLDEFADMVKCTNVKLFGGINYSISGQDVNKHEEDLLKRGVISNISRANLTKEQYLLRSHQFYEAGYDGIYLFNNIVGTNALGLLGDKVKVKRWYTLSYPSSGVQNMITATGTPNILLFDDNTASLATAGWYLNSPPLMGAYVTDSGNSKGNPNNIALKPVDPGQYLFYGDETATGYNIIAQFFTIGSGNWSLRFGARFADLITPSQNFTSTGIAFVVNANEKNYKVTFNDSNRVYFQGVTAAYNDQLAMPTDDEIHTWDIRFDGDETVSLWLDGVKVAEHDDMGTPVPSAADGLTIYNLPLDWQAGTNEVYIQGIRMSRSMETIAPAGIELNTSSMALKIGESAMLSAVITPSNATNQTVLWSTNDQQIATVDANGKVIAVSKGAAIITATAADGGVTAESNVAVVSAASNKPEIPVTGPPATEPPATELPIDEQVLFQENIIDPARLLLLIKEKLQSDRGAHLLPDVRRSHWAYTAIDKLVKLGVAKGYPDGAFKPDQAITRAEFAAMLVRLFAIDDTGTIEINFTDVPQSYWARKAIETLAEHGIVKGNEAGAFQPNAAITREDIVVMLIRLLHEEALPKIRDISFSDMARAGRYARDSITAAAGAGIINGYEDHTFRPKDQATRAEVAAILIRLLELEPALKEVLDQ